MDQHDIGRARPLTRRLRRTLNVPVLSAALLPLAFSGCHKSKPADQFVYVTSKQAYLRDRVAAVSNRTGEVDNGEQLKVLDHARHFVKVQTPKGEVGWIEEKSVATPEVAAEFDQLREEHKGDPTVAPGVVRDEVYLHLKPGRESEHFFLLNENDKLQMLRRSTLVKSGGQATIQQARKLIPQAAGTDATKKAAEPTPASAPAPVLEDWWLVRDAAGHTGWMLSRMMDVDAPDALTRYAEGQRFVGAYVLTTVHDDGAPGDLKDIPEYVTVLSPFKAGLPYDFNQMRVFVWSLNHHRYETGYRDKNIEGYLPVEIFKSRDPGGKGQFAGQELPAFRYRVLAADAPTPEPDPATGELKPAKTITKTYRLEGNQVRRMLPPGQTAPEEAHLEPEEKKGKKGKQK